MSIQANVDSVLVTGGTGFVGLHVCEYFSSAGCSVTAVDLEPFQPGDDPGDVRYVQGDVRNGDVLEPLAEAADAVVHTASAIPTWSEAEIRDATVEGTRTVLEAARDGGVERVVHLSSAAVYGRRDRPSITEDAPLEPRSVYGEAKREAEAVCESFRDGGLCVSVLRPQAVIGPKRLGVFQILFDWVQSGANIPLVGSGENSYQLLHVEDLVSAIDLLLAADRETANRAFNIGADEFDTMKRDFQALVDHAGTGKRVFGTPAVLPVTALRIMDRFDLSPLYPSLFETANEDTYIDVTRLKSVGWEPRYSNREALIDTYDWYRSEQLGPADGRVGNRAARDQLALAPFKRALQLF